MTARISIDGNLVADPDYGVGDSGKSWAHLRVASHERMRRDGEWVSTDPEFYNVTLFGAAAETAANTLHKGDRVNVQGRPQLEVFDRRDGSTGASIKVYARTAVPVDTTSDRDTGSLEAGPETAPVEAPRIHHTPDSTSVVGVARGATALQKILKDNGFRWASATSSWNLPKDMDEHTRTARLSEVLSTVRANGRDLAVTNDPIPTPAAANGVTTTAGAAPSGTVTEVPQRSGRSL